MNHNAIGQRLAAIAHKQSIAIQPPPGNASYFFNSLLALSLNVRNRRSARKHNSVVANF
jgi:hypothetical protein